MTATISPSNNGVPQEPASVNVPDVAAALTGTGAMGIAGMLRQSMMNMSAMAILAGGAVWAVWTLNGNSRDDRDMFREELKAIRADSQDRYVRTEATHGKAMEKMGATIERACTSMERATRALEKTADKLPEPVDR